MEATIPTAHPFLGGSLKVATTFSSTSTAKSFAVLGAITLAALSAEGARPKQDEISREASRSRSIERTDAACYTVYRTYRDAANRCPDRAPTVKVYDFWNGAFRGWSCDCAPRSDQEAAGST